MKLRKLSSNEHGDTIVEVLIAIVVIGAILVGGYFVAITSLNAERSSQDRSEALQTAESQIETLKGLIANYATPTTYFSGNSQINNGQTFCLNGSTIVTPATGSNCIFDTSDHYTGSLTTNPNYRVSIVAANSGADQTAQRIDITVTWQGIDGQQTLKISYRFN